MNVQLDYDPAPERIETDQNTAWILNSLAQDATVLGGNIVEIAGTLDEIDAKSRAQLGALLGLGQAAEQVQTANASVRHAVETMQSTSEATMDYVTESVEHMRHASERTKSFASWVSELEDRMTMIEDRLKSVTASNLSITNISKQVNILAVNAKIEAARAGDMGRGFAVVAEAINELSQKTATAASSITGSVDTLGSLVKDLRSEAQTISQDAAQVIADAESTNTAMESISTNIQEVASSARNMHSEAARVQGAISGFGPTLSEISTVAKDTTASIENTRDRVHALIDTSEAIVQGTVQAGGSSGDQHFIEHVVEMAHQVGQLFENGIDTGEISERDLFDSRYTPISGSNPQQVMAPFTNFTDKVLPQVQEAALEFDPKVVFCAAVDTNGYLPTHNLKFSAPQGDDPAWNAGNCRNRRIFDDRVGLKAGRSDMPFLLQVYRRDMGGGQFAMMKDLSAPIMVRGRHWGGLRFAYTF